MNECQPCTFVQPEGLRWYKKDVSVGVATYYWGESTRAVVWSLAERAVGEWMDEIHGRLAVNLVPLDREEDETKASDIVLTTDFIDGRGNTLGMTYQPRSGDSMEVCDLCGDIVMDRSDVRSQAQFFGTLKHEFGHAWGLNHAPSPDNLMYPSYTGNSALGPWDLAEAQKRYPGPGQLSRMYGLS